MTVAAVARKAGPFINDKETAVVGPFPFTFKIFALTDVEVQRSKSTDLNTGSDTLKYGEDYTVTADLDAQDTNPGGSITLTGTISTATGTLLEPGYSLSILSNVPYSQLTKLTNYDRFMPDVLNDVHDRAVAEIQQLAEKLDRAVMVSTTTTMTPEELVTKLESAADSAEKVAASYASQAQASATSAAASAKKATDVVEGLEDTEAELESQLQAEAVTQKATVTAEGTKQTGLVTAEGTKQLGLIQDKIDYIETIAPSKEDVEIVADNIGTINSLAPHADDLSEIVEHIDEVHTVGQDLQGVNADSLDLGSVADSIDQITTVTDGYIKKVAEHIDDCIHPVGLHLDSIEYVAEHLGVIVIDDALSTTSENAVQNKVITAALATKADSSSLGALATLDTVSASQLADTIDLGSM